MPSALLIVNYSQALGRSRGRLTSKPHMVADARGGFLRSSLTAGQRHDAPQALPLLDGPAPTYLIADRGYDSAPAQTPHPPGLVLQQDRTQASAGHIPQSFDANSSSPGFLKPPDPGQQLRQINTFYVLSRMLIFKENVTGNVFFKNQRFNVLY